MTGDSFATLEDMDMKRTMLAGLIWMLGVTAQAANTVQVDVTGTKTWDPLFPSVSGTTFTDPSRTGFMLDVLTHGPAGGSTVIVAGTVTTQEVGKSSTVMQGTSPWVTQEVGKSSTVMQGTSPWVTSNGQGPATSATIIVPSGTVIGTTMNQGPAGSVSLVSGSTIAVTQAAGLVISVSSTGDIHGVVGPLSRSTTGTPVFMANAGEITYTIVQTGALTGVTVFTDVSNQDTAPASVTGLAAEASEWQTLTPNGNITTAAGGALLGQSPANTFIASGYRWMRWRIEGMANVSNVTLHIMYKARIP